jgi:hypothetical protein
MLERLDADRVADPDMARGLSRDSPLAVASADTFAPPQAVSASYPPGAGAGSGRPKLASRDGQAKSCEAHGAL